MINFYIIIQEVPREVTGLLPMTTMDQKITSAQRVKHDINGTEEMKK